MAPIRRYLRITKHSVLEVRVYLDNPALSNTWLLNSRDPVLPRVMETVRPLVLPKLREENENAKKKGKKRRGVRDVVEGDDFEVSIFLTETSSQHALLTKQKSFASKPRLESNSSKLSDWLNTSDNPIHISDDGEIPAALLREETEEDGDARALNSIPESSESAAQRETRKRRRGGGNGDTLFVQSGDEEDVPDEEDEVQEIAPPSKRRRGRNKLRDTDVTVTAAAAAAAAADDKKKLALSTVYEGFSIYGRILCLIVKRKGAKKSAAGESSQMMENWISTQAAQEGVGDEDDDG